MNLQIRYKRNGALLIPYGLHADWVVKVPTKKNRLIRGGSVGLDLAERFDLKHKKGLLYIDPSAKAYVFIEKEIFDRYTPVMKDCNGVKRSMTCYDLKAILEDNKLQMIPIPEDGAKVAPHETGIAGDVRRKFGL